MSHQQAEALIGQPTRPASRTVPAPALDEPRSWQPVEHRPPTSHVTLKTPPWPGMVWIASGEFAMGSDRHYPEEAPIRRVGVDGFWIAAKPVTNQQFARFVRETGWITTAERPVNPALYPDCGEAMLEPASVVFVAPARQPIEDISDWWRYVRGADWMHPTGPKSSVAGLDEHPVVHVSWNDVRAYADWAGADLPTEAEWEFAARGGLDGADFAWGDEMAPGGKQMANIWQGDFPFLNTQHDGCPRTSPVGAYPPNGHGLSDMIGNVWEWTADWWLARRVKSAVPLKNPRGGIEELSLDPGSPDVQIARKVLKGGSYLSAPNYCRRYRPAARHAHPVDTATSHIGFRVVVRS